VREAAIGQGATNALSAGSRGQAGPTEWSRPSGERGSDWLGKKRGPRLGRKQELGPIQVIKPF
jgi:hypothetical protein